MRRDDAPRLPDRTRSAIRRLSPTPCHVEKGSMRPLVRLGLVLSLPLLAPVFARAADPTPAAPPAPAQPAAAPAPAAAGAADENTLYALGVHASRNLKQFNLTPHELEIVKKGLTDSLTGQKLKVDMEQYDEKVQKLAEARAVQTAKVNAEAGKAFVAKAAAEKGA